MATDPTRRHVRTSKFLSLVLRHRPESIGITLDAGGWVPVDTLLDACARHGRPLRHEELLTVVQDNDKQRFALRDGRIRASQGHSVAVDLGLTPRPPPATLFHGTAEHLLESIEARGLLRGQRHHVHLSADAVTARAVGARHGKPIVFEVAARTMHERGMVFYRSDNGVWLTDAVPHDFLARVALAADAPGP